MADIYGNLMLVFRTRLNYVPAVRLKVSSKLVFASCVWYSDRITGCVLIKDIGRRLSLELACIRVNRVMFNLCTDTITLVLGGTI